MILLLALQLFQTAWAQTPPAQTTTPTQSTELQAQSPQITGQLNSLTTNVTKLLKGHPTITGLPTFQNGVAITGPSYANISSYTIVSNSAVYSPIIGFGWQNYQKFTVNGSSWCAPANVTRVMAWIVGGGGGGGDSHVANFTVTGSGGGGGCTDIIISTVTPGSCYAVHIGSAGVGGATQTAGTNAGPSTFLGETAGGGYGGGAAKTGADGSNGGQGGLCSGVGLFFTGNVGMPEEPIPATGTGAGGLGGTAGGLGAMGGAISGGFTCVAGPSYGGTGGNGGAYVSPTYETSCNGETGYVIIWW